MDAFAPSCVRHLLAAAAILRHRRPINEILCFAEAFEECAIVLHVVGDVRLFDSGADHALRVIRDAVDCSEIVVWDSRGKQYARAESLSPVERAAFEDAVERLLRFMNSRAGKRYLQALDQERSQSGAA
jgi:hypothetical protein